MEYVSRTDRGGMAMDIYAPTTLGERLLLNLLMEMAALQLDSYDLNQNRGLRLEPHVAGKILVIVDGVAAPADTYFMLSTGRTREELQLPDDCPADMYEDGISFLISDPSTGCRWTLSADYRARDICFTASSPHGTGEEFVRYHHDHPTTGTLDSGVVEPNDTDAG